MIQKTRQKAEPAGGVAPQLPQVSSSRAPHALQKAEPAGGVAPQVGQVTVPSYLSKRGS